MTEYALEEYNEDNGYCVLSDTLENDPHVFFHITPWRNFESIKKDGFNPAYGSRNIKSTSYAYKTSACLAHWLSLPKDEDYVLLAVKFDDNFDLKDVVRNPSDIYVYGISIQPKIIGYAVIPKGFKYI